MLKIIGDIDDDDQPFAEKMFQTERKLGPADAAADGDHRPGRIESNG
jgi:hypothetical protein